MLLLSLHRQIIKWLLCASFLLTTVTQASENIDNLIDSNLKQHKLFVEQENKTSEEAIQERVAEQTEWDQNNRTQFLQEMRVIQQRVNGWPESHHRQRIGNAINVLLENYELYTQARIENFHKQVNQLLKQRPIYITHELQQFFNTVKSLNNPVNENLKQELKKNFEKERKRYKGFLGGVLTIFKKLPEHSQERQKTINKDFKDIITKTASFPRNRNNSSYSELYTKLYNWYREREQFELSYFLPLYQPTKKMSDKKLVDTPNILTIGFTRLGAYHNSFTTSILTSILSYYFLFQMLICNLLSY
ncbi:MAG: hypothetical protein AAF770_02875 [Bacteroidota bacterium]